MRKWCGTLVALMLNMPDVTSFIVLSNRHGQHFDLEVFIRAKEQSKVTEFKWMRVASCVHTPRLVYVTKADISAQEGAERGCDLLQPCTEKGNLLRNNAQVSNACQKTCCSFVPSINQPSCGHTQLNQAKNDDDGAPLDKINRYTSACFCHCHTFFSIGTTFHRYDRTPDRNWAPIYIFNLMIYLTCIRLKLTLCQV